MCLNVDIFTVDIKETADGNFIHFLNINQIDDKIQNLINKHIVSICESETDTHIDLVKKELKTFFLTKGENIKMGAVSEFIIHLYLKEIGFNQECLYRNLEENSIKKGFDGYYTFERKEWIMESKSGSIETNGISHKSKIKEAYSDLKSKIEGKGNNNPWKNALHHAKLVGRNPNIIKNIKTLSANYVNNVYPKIENLNIIPASTIFHDIGWKDENVQPKSGDILSLLPDLKYNKINVICVNKKSVSDFITYLTQ